MAQLNINNAATGNAETSVKNYSVPTINTDAANGLQETEYIWDKWSSYLGYYKKIPELKRAIDAKAVWTLGKGWKADIPTTVVLEHISGYGPETFNTILKNMLVTMHINGDAFAEVIRDEKTGELINLKPLDPGTIKLIVNKKGIIQRYEQMSKTGKDGKLVNTFKPREILHFVYNRIADEIHGTSIIESVEECILRRNEALSDWKKALHRNVKPLIMFKLSTDDATKINNFISKMDKAVDKGENVYIPGEDTVKFEILSVPANATLNPMPWIEYNEDFFYKAVGVPSIILGGSKEFTEATAKISYLVFQQDVEESQLYIETQLFEQLGLKIELEFPASLQNELLSDEKKDANSMAPIKPQEMYPNMQQE